MMRYPWRVISLFAATVVAGGCVTPPPPPAVVERAPAAPTSGTSERHAALGKQLDDSIGAFDARLREEQKKIAEERDARQTAVTTVATDGGDPDAPAGGALASGASAEVPSQRSGNLKSEKAADVRGNGAPATVIADGNDDDIVARRLRKAAEQETDPELKDKLWKEYVEYKKNTPVR